MKPSIEELFNSDRYIQLAELAYTEMIPFVQHEFAQRSNIIRGYIWLNIFILLMMVLVGARQVWNGEINFWSVIAYTFLGFAITLTLLVPVHEAIHGLAYKLLGAPKVAFGGNLKKFYFYAAADRFVVGAQGFRFVALTPFMVITIATIIGLYLTPVNVQWLLWGILLMHTGACAGDFGMLGFYKRHHENGEIFTFDDVSNKRAYFFQKK